MYSIEQIKAMGKNRSRENFNRLLHLFFLPVLPKVCRCNRTAMTNEYEDGNNVCFKFPFGQDSGNVPVPLAWRTLFKAYE